MEKIQLVNQEENNLRIVEHLDMQSLPEPLQQMLSLAVTPEEQDSLLGENFHSAVVRMAVQIERIALILTALRLAQPSSISPASDAGATLSIDPALNAGSSSTARSESSEPLTCLDADYATAELIGSKLILHLAATYKLIDGDQTELVPSVATTCQKQLLFKRLSSEYEHRDLLTESKDFGISRATAIRWNDAWLEDGLIQRTHRGMYRKIG